MLDHKKEAITEHWQFCPKCNIKLYRMTADCTGFIHIKCWRCREMLWLNLSIRGKAFKIAIVPSADRSMDTCTVCQTRRGHDYVVMNR